MFPTFDVPPQHAETVRERKIRKAREQETTRRASSVTSHSSGSVHSVRGGGSERQPSTSSASSSTKTGSRSGFGWFSRSSNKGIQEISTSPALGGNSSQPQSQSQSPSQSQSQPPDAEPSPIQPDSPVITAFPGDPPPPQAPHRLAGLEETQHFHKQLQLFPPPAKSLPSRPPPPSGALPQPPTRHGSRATGRIDTTRPIDNIDGTKPHYLNPYSPSAATSSSDRTMFSNKSVFSSTATTTTTSSSSRYDDALSRGSTYSEELSPSMVPPASATSFTFADSGYARPPPLDRPHVDPRFTSNVQLEPVDRDARAASRLGDRGTKTAQGPFARALAKMENAGARIISARLEEEWGSLDDDDESHQEIVFEKRLWALTAYQRLTQNKHLQSPAHEILSGSRLADQRRILHLHGSLADGWMLASRYPAATVYTMSSMKTMTQPTSYPAPLNHHCLYVPSLSSAMPFPDGYFDAIISRSVSTILRNDEWARSFFDCMRVLKPGGQIEILSIDAHLSSEGQKLSAWVDEHITCRLEAHDMSMQASDTVLDMMEIVGLENIRRARVALPAHLGTPKVPNAQGAASSPQDIIDTSRMMAFLGRHFYQDLYGQFLNVDQGEEWFWSRKDTRDECQRYQTKMVLTIACALKPAATVGTDGYLHI